MSTLYGVDLWERNFGKFIPHFKTWNSLMPLWTNTDFGLDQLYPVFAGIGAARQSSPALRSSNRYFLNLTSGNPQERLFSVAKFVSRNAPPNISDTVLAFANLDRNADQSGTFNVNIDADSSGTNDFGIKRGRSYRLRNIAAHEGITAGRRLAPLTTATGDSLLDSGLPVTARKVPVTNAAWATVPFEALYLKLEDITPPLAPAAPFAAQPYVIGNDIAVSWSAVVDQEAGITGYRAGISGAVTPVMPVITTSAAALNALFTSTGNAWADGATVSLSVRSISLTGIDSAPGPALILRRLQPAGDFDSDGFTNTDEDIMGTDPLSAASAFRLLSQGREGSGAIALTIPTVAGRTYTLRSSTDLAAWINEDDPGVTGIPGTGNPLTMRDLNPAGARKFYSIAVAR